MSLTREEKIVNLMANHTMLFASMFEDAFADLAAKLAEVTVGMGDVIASAMSDGLSGPSHDVEAKKRVEKIRVEIGPQASAQIREMFSGIRKEVSSRMSEIRDASAHFANPAFDRGIAIVEGYDFGLPRLTEKLSDDDLASYLVLLKSGDGVFGKMLRELGQWQEGLPKPPGVE